MLPHLALRNPEGLAAHAAVGDAQRRRVGDLGRADEVEHILIELGLRDIMLQRGVAVGDERDVHSILRPAFGHHGNPLTLRGRDHLLTLLAARLVIVLDAVRAFGLEAADMGECIVETVDDGVASRRFRAIDDLAAGEGARGEDDARALHLAGREDEARGARRIVDGGDAEREVGERFPILLRNQIVLALRAMGMGIDEAGDDRLAGDIDGARIGGDRDFAAAADRADAVIFDQDDAILDDPTGIVGHGDDLRSR